MLKYEWKKLLLHRRGLWLILVFLLSELLGILLFTEPYDQVLENNREIYGSYLASVTGSLTEEKRAFLETEMDRLNQVHLDVESLKQDYYSGKVSEEEYRVQFEKLLAEDQRYTGFGKLYEQYIFVREDTNRSFLYTGGWEVLLTDQEPDYLFLLLLIAVIAPVFCEEYTSRMYEIHLTQKRSARCQVPTKVCVVLTMTVVLTAMVQGMDLLYCAARFGLPNGNFTLQSLRSFGTATKGLSLWQAFGLQFALKEFGYCYAAILILFLAVLLKKYALTLMAGISALILPFLTAESNDRFLHIPGPWALTLGSIYLNGRKSGTNRLTGETVTVAEELSMAELGALLGIAALICGGMLLFLQRKNTNHQSKRHKHLGVLGMFFATVLVLTGCGPSGETVIYNSATSGWCESGQYMLLLFQEQAILVDKETNDVYPFPPDAFAEETVTASGNFYYKDGCAYYIREEQLHPSAGFDSSVTGFYSLVQIDLDTMTETVLYPWNTQNTWFFGLMERESGEVSPGRIRTFFLHDHRLYYLDDGSLCTMDLTSGNSETYLDSLTSQDIAYDGQSFYYTDAYSRLVIHDLQSGAEQPVDEVVAERFLLTQEGIYFLNRRDENTLYYWDRDNGETVKICDIPATSFYWDEGYFWIFSKADSALYRVDHTGGNTIQVMDAGTILGIGTEYLYVYRFQDQCLYAILKTDGTKIPLQT